MKNLSRWRLCAMASAIALLGSMATLEAHAVALGRIKVQSALGEALRAEVDISDLSAEEASSLQVGLAAPESFKAAGFEYSSAVVGLNVKVQRRADGRSYLLLSSNRAITEPFVDLILEAKWSSGRVTRDYTMLFDPPNLRAGSLTSPAPAAPVLSRAPVPSASLEARQTSPRPYEPRPAVRAVAPRTPVAEKSSTGVTRLTVKSGENASKIAAQNKPASVSLDQMLVALLRSNPDAFVGGNINILKAGSVLDMPNAQTASAITPAEATKTLIAQSADFNRYRRKLAEGVPTAQTANADRQIGGKLQTRVEDSAPASATPDKLTLSRGAVQAKPAIAPDTKDPTSPGADLPPNNSTANPSGSSPATSTAIAAPGGPIPASAASSPTATTGIAAIPALASSSAADANSATLSTDAVQAPIAVASEAAPAASVMTPPAVIQKPVAVAPVLPAEPGVMDFMRDNLLVLLGAGGLLALLAAWGLTRRRNYKTSDVDNSSFIDSRMQQDSFFDASGGRLIDTHESNLGSSSLNDSPSHLDPSDEVDPVAEADVYLAYGRDQQAEEILRDALRTHKGRLAIHTKLLEIFAKRRDRKAFESVALSAFKISKGQGGQWAYIAEMGRDLDPENITYQPDVGPSDSMLEYSSSAFMPVSASAPLGSADTAVNRSNAVNTDLGLDLDLNFSADDSSANASVGSSPAAVTSQSVKPSATLNLDALDFDLNLGTAAQADSPPPIARASSAPQKISAPEPDLGFLSEGLNFTSEPYVPPKASLEPSPPITQGGMLEFDLNSLSLDLDSSTQPLALPTIEPERDPLEIKFLLAEEFRILGDADGARSLADEVMVNAEGPLRIKAQAFLNTLS